MTYLDIAKRVQISTKKTKEVGTEQRDDGATGDERNERNEKSPLLSPKDARQLTARLALQDEIVRTASAARDAFDRATYDEVWRRWSELQEEAV